MEKGSQMMLCDPSLTGSAILAITGNTRLKGL